jgi:hypothetical protein
VPLPYFAIGYPQTAKIVIMLDNWISPDISTSHGKHIRPPWGTAESGGLMI